MNERAQFLVKYLADQHGIGITEDIAREDISTQVDRVAERMRIGRQAAKYYVTEDYLRKFGDFVANAIREAQAADPRRGLRAVPPAD
ncbi:hypothetical protein PROPHIGD05-2_66 [Mycobacterium phage prophiGD05-2]|jgi:cobalamin biosynthesis protein CbiG|uniref:hypothetical protein n=1 Tax=Mycobacteroides abscessus TaxID=36809 RepID=UPI0002FBB6B5|nr:hypothetical protein [Mycobacteroides abscessus]QST90137.1 hypothetical protein PROPHIGD05-2_66 [Mycobacterium phage prophiGD05-2]SKM67630.1 Uncharacterised protein [Mycobacteroides abscessus subsp. bolletii]MDO2987929.1 hypothetical protein [Mycobacteroides abscessus subsp. massiliense]OTR21956.1 hypothetical protein B9M80_16150 [Mycobacteroides abscessus]QSN54858.1 hypothetical protein I3U39_15855 [Mycobacteroides abscessus subsp. abscessus]